MRDAKDVPFAEMTIPPGYDVGFEHGGKESVGKKIISRPDDDGMNGYIWKTSNGDHTNWKDWILGFHVMQNDGTDDNSVAAHIEAINHSQYGAHLFSKESFSLAGLIGQKIISYYNTKKDKTEYSIYIAVVSACKDFRFDAQLVDQTARPYLTEDQIEKNASPLMSIVKSLKVIDKCHVNNK